MNLLIAALVSFFVGSLAHSAELCVAPATESGPGNCICNGLQIQEITRDNGTLSIWASSKVTDSSWVMGVSSEVLEAQSITANQLTHRLFAENDLRICCAYGSDNGSVCTAFTLTKR